MSKIVKVLGRQILDSRGTPTVEVELWTEFGGHGIAKVPSGASTGANEALELRDGGEKYNGKAVSKAVENVNKKIAPAVVGMEVRDQLSIDQAMINLDGTEFKKNLGANAMLGVSLAAARAAADEMEMPLYNYLGGPGAHKLPVPMLNVINGGEHADSAIDFQEFMIMPVGAPSFGEAIRWSSEVFQALKSILKEKGDITAVGDEGGFAPNFKWAYPKETAEAFKKKMPVEVALDILVEAVEKAGYKTGKEGFMFAMDAAASELYFEDKKYHFKKIEKITGQEFSMTSVELNKFLEDLTKKYPIVSIEDGFDEGDWEGFSKFNQEVGKNVQNVGDDLYTTNPKFIREGIHKNATNSVLIKLNQIGTLSETIEAIQMTQKNNWTAIVSHRSGETEDTTIADLAVAFNTGQIKTGSMSRSDRIAKYNRLLEIEDELGVNAVYEGAKTFYNLEWNK
ncbi:Enolase [Mesoplasma sp. JKS002658]|uniref:phosphopyruvate hydratase n=1 Tax=Mesoplasma whartonense TaxID=2878854 RepID=UPI002022A4D7|nr:MULTISPECIES: phosphopyruvate hydratase [unclassified Mesoplasma]MCL8211555.1 Enolase [Mesoplasma sp. JKS002664]MCL8212015.1 Enolase [Mesoplasma sp. JKS002662]MCL8213047.1 Enolase [Mesoplasma sp. JKS002661]MCL8213635.1 Enolase [Mesoplasma sp. JKS002660]MCL8213880.1 Enolase [Mesoplasma sp. JKS002658]